MRRRLVAPGVPNGIPALIRIVSPGFANSSATACRHACSTISATSETSGVCTECTPQTKARQRAVARLGVILRIGGTLVSLKATLENNVKLAIAQAAPSLTDVRRAASSFAMRIAAHAGAKLP